MKIVEIDNTDDDDNDDDDDDYDDNHDNHGDAHNDDSGAPAWSAWASRHCILVGNKKTLKERCGRKGVYLDT